MGRPRRPRGRQVDGILLLDKPLGITSNDALQKVKRLFFAQKAGHTGSLDPLADGLLPICFGNATKLSAFLLDADKYYWVRVKLGETTTTQDAEGERSQGHGDESHQRQLRGQRELRSAQRQSGHHQNDARRRGLPARRQLEQPHVEVLGRVVRAE